MTTLDQVPTGRRCQVAGLDGPAALVQRLLEFGIMDGEDLVVIGRAPLGDPIEIESSLTRLSLRAADAAFVRVSLTD